MINEDVVSACFDRKREEFYKMADRIWDTPQVCFQETHAVEEHSQFLEEEGFKVTRNFCGMETAVCGEFGEDGPVIAILGEYDALPGMSQQANVTEKMALDVGADGHACGHNLLGTGSLMAATAVKDWLKASGLPGRVRYYGCPAEEGGAGKGFMVREGGFDDVDIAMCWHPNAFTGVNPPLGLACARVDYTFSGRSSHASASPHLGRSALDAVELMNVGANYLREHILSSSRLHYAILDAGGKAPNVVQSHAKVRYAIRTRELEDLHDLIDRVTSVAKGAAMMTGTEVEVFVGAGMANLVGVESLDRLMQSHLEKLGPPPFDAADIARAKDFQATMSKQDIDTAFARFALKTRPGLALTDSVLPLNSSSGDFVGSTDLGTVSWVTPTVYIRSATYAIGTPGHSWQLTAQGKLPAAHKGMEHAGRALANCAIDLLQHSDKLAEIKAEFAAQMDGRPFQNPLPADLKAGEFEF